MNGIFCLLLIFSFQQDDEIITERLDTTISGSDLFAEAREKYNSVRRNESETIFRQIVTLLDEKTELNDDERLIMAKTLEYLGVLTFPDGTQEHFTKLILFDPTYEPVQGELPPKIMSVYHDLKNSLVSTLRVTARDGSDNTEIDGADLYLNGEHVGSIFRETVFTVPVGPHSVEIRKANYDPSSAELDVISGQESSYDGLLFRNAAELLLVTSPPGVKVSMGGEVLGTTEMDVPSGYRGILRNQGLEDTAAGALIVNGLQPGNIVLTFEKPCFQTRNIGVEIEKLEQIPLAPVLMATSQASISVRTAGGEDTGGLLFLDQKRVGYLPIESHLVCPGEYELKVRFTDGEFIRRVTILEDKNLEVVAEPLPSIVWFGLEENDETPPAIDLNQRMMQLKTWNVRPIDPHNTEQVPINPFPVLFGADEMNDENNSRLTRQLNADLFGAARVVRRKGVISILEVAFWSPISKKIRVHEIDFRELDRFEDLMRSFERFPQLTKPWLGIHVARMRGVTGCKVIDVDPRGPLAGKVQPADMITDLNNAIMRNPGDLLELPDLSAVTLSVNGQSVTVTPINTIAEVDTGERSVSMQAYLARFQKLARYHKDPLVRMSARFNQGRIQLSLGDYQRAFDIFASMNLPMSYGINQGTLYYYQALCFQRLGLDGEARSALKKVMEYPGATLFDANGPKAAFWARAELGSSM